VGGKLACDTNPADQEGNTRGTEKGKKMQKRGNYEEKVTTSGKPETRSTSVNNGSMDQDKGRRPHHGKDHTEESGG